MTHSDDVEISLGKSVRSRFLRFLPTLAPKNYVNVPLIYFDKHIRRKRDCCRDQRKRCAPAEGEGSCRVAAITEIDVRFQKCQKGLEGQSLLPLKVVDLISFPLEGGRHAEVQLTQSMKM